MPCYDPEPNEREKRSRKVASLLCYTQKALGQKPHELAVKASSHPFGDKGLLDSFTEHLCELCGGMTEEQEATIIYDGRNPEARKLADWWDRHQAADRAREAAELRESENAEIRAALLKSLSEREKEALGIK